jgi:hypothetical protein
MKKTEIDIQDVYTFMNEKNILFSFVGDLSHEVTSSLLKNVKLSINRIAGVKAVIKKKLYNIIVECIDNVATHNIHHDVRHGHVPPVLFILSRHSGHFKIITGNYVTAPDIRKIKSHIDTINTLNRHRLKKWYLEEFAIRNHPKNYNRTLGLIEIGLKAKGKLHYDFKAIGKGYSFYTFQAEV